jgi:hypothetical protein
MALLTSQQEILHEIQVSPPTLSFPLPQRNGTLLGRQQIQVVPTTAGPYSGSANNRISFTLPNTSMLSFDNTCGIKFRLTFPNGGGNAAFASIYHSSSPFRNITIRFVNGGGLIENIRNANVLTGEELTIDYTRGPWFVNKNEVYLR